jgi:uncharacterized membrane protein YkoI
LNAAIPSGGGCDSGGREARPLFHRPSGNGRRRFLDWLEVGIQSVNNVIDAMPMSKRGRSLLAVVAAATLIGGAGLAQAATRGQAAAEHGSALASGEALDAAFITQLPQRRSLSLAEAISIAQSRYPGRVVRAQTIEQGNGPVHEVRIIGNDGRVHTIRVDGRTGSVQ